MLHHFRKYQQYIYIVVTIVIVISFSFFGTYGTLNERSTDGGQAFIAYNGSSISNRELNEYERFFSSDSIDKIILGAAPGPNFLNDGVIARDIFEKRLAYPLFKDLEPSIKDETNSRFAKEKNFQPYKNPKAPFLGVESSWNYFVPEMNRSFALLKNAKNPFDEDVFNAKIALYLGQRKVPPHYLQQLLMYQQAQYGEKFTDPDLKYQDLSLFGYRNLEEWFGAKFVKGLSAFIINASMIAEQKGYRVSKEEAQADLMRLAIQSFKENQSSPYMTAANVGQYFQEQLRRMNIDQTTAIKIWQRALLFKRMMQDIGGSVFISGLPFQAFHKFSDEKATGTLYALPEEFKLRTPKDLQLLEVYFEAIGKDKGSDSLSVPKNIKPIADIAKSAPELVQQSVLLDVASVTEGQLLSRIGLKEMWRWQVADNNWSLLTKNFPELGLQSAKTPDERQAILDSLSLGTKQKVNAYSKKEILKEHPEWTQEALANADYEEMSISLNLAEGSSPLNGISSKELLRAVESQKGDSGPITLVSKDGQTRYLIKVKEIKESPVVLTFAEAKKGGQLEKILDKKLNAHYEKIRNLSAENYQNADGSWKKLPEVESKVAEDLFSSTLALIRKNLPQEANNSSFQDLAPYRLMGYVKQAHASVAENSKDQGRFINNDENAALADQWKLQMLSFNSTRATHTPPLLSDTQGMAPHSLSKVFVQPEGDVYFFLLNERTVDDHLGKGAESALSVQHILGSEAEKELVAEILKKMNEKNALNLSVFSNEAS